MKSAFAVIVDFVALVGLMCVVASGAVMRWKLLPGSETYGFPIGRRFEFKLEGQTFLGWDRTQWSEIHFWLAAAFVAVIVIHFLIGWSRSESKA